MLSISWMLYSSREYLVGTQQSFHLQLVGYQHIYLKLHQNVDFLGKLLVLIWARNSIFVSPHKSMVCLKDIFRIPYDFYYNKEGQVDRFPMFLLRYCFRKPMFLRYKLIHLGMCLMHLSSHIPAYLNSILDFMSIFSIFRFPNSNTAYQNCILHKICCQSPRQGDQEDKFLYYHQYWDQLGSHLYLSRSMQKYLKFDLKDIS